MDQIEKAHSLNDAQKITSFTNGLRDAEASRYAINARKAIVSLPAHEQTFDNYYNALAADLNTFNTLTAASHVPPTRKIGSMNTGDGRGRGLGRSPGSGRGRGRGRDRGHHPYSNSMVPFAG